MGNTASAAAAPSERVVLAVDDSSISGAYGDLQRIQSAGQGREAAPGGRGLPQRTPAASGRTCGRIGTSHV